MLIHNKKFEGSMAASDLNIVVNKTALSAKLSSNLYKYFATQEIYVNVSNSRLKSKITILSTRLPI
jgi:hypothetical protein